MSEPNKIEGRRAKILVVDDEEIVLSLARDALEDAGYEITTAEGSLEAMEKIEKEYFDFLLSDIRMPDMDGIELAQKAREKNPSIGVIFMTGYANLNSAKVAIKEGAYDYIMKPFELNEIRQAVKNAIKKKQKDIEKTLSSELTRLSDLNQLMYTVGDLKSLMRLSLGFAMMQTRADRGGIVFKTHRENEIGAIATENLHDNDFTESFRTYDTDYFEAAPAEIGTPFVIKSAEEHPLFLKYNDRAVSELVIPGWYREGDQLLNIALSRGNKLYGMVVLGFPEDSEPLKDSEMKFLSITANQIAISMENISLLEETREAYRRLKDLQEQSIQLEKMATRGQMSAEIGHELNNFLGVVTGNLSLMERHLENKNFSELEKYLKVAIQNLENIQKFSRGLMDFSGMQSNFEPVDVNTLISDTIDYIKMQKRFEEIEISFDNSTLAIFAMADSSQLQQLLYNLIFNAADAIESRHEVIDKKITITTERDNDTFRISTSDNGIGIPEELQGKIFSERFTTKKSGHGFGLLVCQRIIENHKGRVSIDSRAGHGTTITIEFPLLGETEKAEAVI